VAFVDANRGDIVEGRKLGVEPICEILQVVPSSYYAAKRRQPSQRSVRDEQLSVRDEQLTPQLLQLWEANYRLYGARKLWKAARRAGHDVGRDQVARLMRAAGIEGVTRTKHVRTCHSDAGSQFTSLRYGERLAELGTVPSIGTVGDSFDNALAETVNGYYKAELIRGPPAPAPGRPSRTSSSPPSAGSTGTTPPDSTATSATDPLQSSKPGSTLPTRPTNNWSESNSPSLHRTQGGSSVRGSLSLG
jgi:transposase InsO family protein